MKTGSSGFTLSQQLIALTIVGTVAAISSIVLVDFTQKLSVENDTKIANKITNDITNVWQMKNTRDGLISRDDTPSDIILNALKDGSSSITTSTIPSGCNINLPAKQITVMNGDWTIYAEATWRVASNRKDTMRYCIKRTDGNYTANNTLQRHGLSNSGQLLANVSNLNSSSTDNISNSSSNSTDSSSDVTLNSNIEAPAVDINDPPPPPPPPVSTWDQEVAVFGRERNGERGVGRRADRAANQSLFSNFYNSQQMKNFFDQDTQTGYTPTLYDQAGNLLQKLTHEIFWTNLTMDLTDGRTDVSYAARINELKASSLDYARLSWILTPATDKAWIKAVEDDTKIYMNGVNTEKLFWKDPKTGRKYRIRGFELRFSPVKINLNAKNAEIDSKNQFKLDVDGFSTQSFPLMKTSGGISGDEAWLLLDRGTPGFNKESLIDGDDLFGDHMGKFTSGYEDLAGAFKSSIHIDDKGKRYLDLTPLPWWEQMWIGFLRFLGFAKDTIPSIDLKLLKLSGETILASDILKRVDLDYKNVEEYDDKNMNAIFQRADVTYIDGTIASSADQWFKPIKFFQAIPVDDNNNPLSTDNQ